MFSFLDGKLADNYEKQRLEAQQAGLIPSKQKMFNKKRFYAVYDHVFDFWKGLAMPFLMPLSGLFQTIIKMCEAAWALIRVVGNLLIIKPALASVALKDSAFYFSVAVTILVTMPINAVLFSAELFSRNIASWLSKEQERTTDLPNTSLYQRFTKGIEPCIKAYAIPTQTNVNKAKFFTPYTGFNEVVIQVITPVAKTADNLIQCLSEILQAIYDLLTSASNLVIAKPQHALDDLKSVSIHLAISIVLAVVIPVNVLLDTTATVSRFGATWYNAYNSEEETLTAQPA